MNQNGSSLFFFKLQYAVSPVRCPLSIILFTQLNWSPVFYNKGIKKKKPHSRYRKGHTFGGVEQTAMNFTLKVGIITSWGKKHVHAQDHSAIKFISCAPHSHIQTFMGMLNSFVLHILCDVLHEPSLWWGCAFCAWRNMDICWLTSITAWEAFRSKSMIKRCGTVARGAHQLNIYAKRVSVSPLSVHLFLFDMLFLYVLLVLFA